MYSLLLNRRLVLSSLINENKHICDQYTCMYIVVKILTICIIYLHSIKQTMTFVLQCKHNVTDLNMTWELMMSEIC